MDSKPSHSPLPSCSNPASASGMPACTISEIIILTSSSLWKSLDFAEIRRCQLCQVLVLCYNYTIVLVAFKYAVAYLILACFCFVGGNRAPRWTMISSKVSPLYKVSQNTCSLVAYHSIRFGIKSGIFMHLEAAFFPRSSRCAFLAYSTGLLRYASRWFWLWTHYSSITALETAWHIVASWHRGRSLPSTSAQSDRTARKVVNLRVTFFAIFWFKFVKIIIIGLNAIYSIWIKVKSVYILKTWGCALK